MLDMLSSLAEPGEPNPVLEILEVYRTDGHLMLGRLEEAIREGDDDATRRAAHRLKGSSGNIGASAMSSAMDRIEKQALQGMLDGLETSLDEARQLFDETLSAIEAYCG